MGARVCCLIVASWAIAGCGRLGFDGLGGVVTGDGRGGGDSSGGDSTIYDSGCGAAGASCWDVSATFTASDFAMDPASLGIFGAQVINNQSVYALFDGTEDNTYSEVNPYDCPPYYTGAIRARAWAVERKRIDASTYRILVRGISDADCNRGQPKSAGHIELNLARGWTLSATTSCSVVTDTMNSNNVLIPTFCTVDAAAGTITWQSGSTCGGCCACADGAGVGIDVTVTHP